MLELDRALPPGALCAADPDTTARALDGAHWWHGDAQTMARDPDSQAVTGWTDRIGGLQAIPTDPNDGNALVGEVDTLTGLQCRPKTHCGLVAEAAVAEAASATMAIRFYVPPGEEGRTLLTLNAADGGNYLFLSHADGVLTAKDDSDLVSIDLPCPDRDAPRMAIVSVSGTGLALSLGPERTDGTASGDILSGPASLFFGCRNHRPRLFKTLGSALILDVWLFPGRALLHSGASSDRAALDALTQHHLWSEA